MSKDRIPTDDKIELMQALVATTLELRRVEKELMQAENLLRDIRIKEKAKEAKS